MKTFRIEITSVPDREELVAEIWNENQMIAEINQDSENLILEIYSNQNSTLKIDYDAFLKVLIEAKDKLTK